MIEQDDFFIACLSTMIDEQTLQEWQLKADELHISLYYYVMEFT
jgi:hypothetical protein